MCWILTGINLLLQNSSQISMSKPKHPENLLKDNLTHWPQGDVAVILTAIFKFIVQSTNLSAHCEIALMWMPINFTDDKSTLAQVMSWCCQAASNYLNHCDHDLCHHMASSGHSEFSFSRPVLYDKANCILPLQCFSVFAKLILHVYCCDVAWNKK